MGDAQLVPAIGGNNFGVSQNRAWDGIWLARVRRHELGWTVEVQIPFRTVNFDPSGVPGARTFSERCDVRTKNFSGMAGGGTRAFTVWLSPGKSKESATSRRATGLISSLTSYSVITAQSRATQLTKRMKGSISSTGL